MQCPQCSVKQCRKCSSRTMNRCGSCFAACCITPPPPPPPPPPQCFLHYSTSWTQTPLHLATILSCPFKLLVDRIIFFILSLFFWAKTPSHPSSRQWLDAPDLFWKSFQQLWLHVISYDLASDSVTTLEFGHIEWLMKKHLWRMAFITLVCVGM